MDILCVPCIVWNICWYQYASYVHIKVFGNPLNVWSDIGTKTHKEKIQQYATMYQNFIIPYFYEAQHVSDDTPPIIRSLKLHWQPLVFHTCRVVGRVAGGRCQAQYDSAWQSPPTTRPTTFHLWKTRGCQCSFRLLMMGGVSPETCWASYKYGIIKFWYIVASCWIFSLWNVLWCTDPRTSNRH